MQISEQYGEKIDRLMASLSPDRIAEIDLDGLREALGTHREIVRRLQEGAEALAQLREDHAVLRGEYIGRIAGMVKAVAAVMRVYEGGPRERVYREALRYIESLDAMSAAELIEQYRISAARFREAFPASFGPFAGKRRG